MASLGLTVWRGAEAWVLRSPRLTLVVTQVGGHIAHLSHTADKNAISPFWQVLFGTDEMFR